MIHRVSVIAFILLLLMSGCSNREETNPVTGLVERIAPQFADDIVFEHMESPSGQDLFELESTGKGKILIRGNHFLELRDPFTSHYNSKNLDSLRITGTMMKELLNDLERLLSTRPSFWKQCCHCGATYEKIQNIHLKMPG